MKFTQLKKLLKKYLSSRGTTAERRVVDIWYESFSQRKEDVPILDDAETKENLRKQIWANLPISFAKPSWRSRHKTFLFSCGAAAALTLFFFGGYLLLRNQENLELDASKVQLLEAFTSATVGQERKLVTLPDSSKVWLNANSSLAVEAGYGVNGRLVNLDGEAFFDVKPNAQQPFVVKTRHLKVKVLGTAFNVSAYKGVPRTQVAVEHGKVAVWDKEGGQLHKQLTKGESLIYDSDLHQIDLSDIEGIGTWRTGHVILERASFQELSRTVFNIYGVQLTTQRKEPKSYSYNLEIYASHSLAQTMDIICSMHRLKYRREKDEIVLY
ncbi:FecR family protein [Sphingobacterium sp. LRF_L2]|uniref:FecR family protein n=1 Tax=Sphingobacterium sp. LRF_L2 TaxID=3369421 RepID=UPI003F6205FD